MNLLHSRQHRNTSNRSRRQWLLWLASLCLLALVVYGLYLGFYIIEAYRTARSLTSSVERLQLYVHDRDIDRITQELPSVKQEINSLQKNLAHLKVLSYVYYVRSQYDTVVTLLDTGNSLVDDAQQSMVIVQEIAHVFQTSTPVTTFRGITEAQKGAILEILQKHKTTTTAILHDLQTQSKVVNTIDTTTLYPTLGDAVTRLKGPLEEGSNILNAIVPLFDSLSSMVGFPQEKTYLFLMQNNTEVRATGGFIGNYGILTLHNGEIRNFHTDNIYNLDDPAAAYLHITPPKPFFTFFTTNKSWFLRDSNWSPDFSESAQNAIRFYQQEGGKEHIDGVIAITQDFIIPFLRFTGPIDVEGTVFTADNFEQELEYQVEKGYYQKGIPEAQRKEVIGTLANKMMERLYNLPSSQWGDVFATAQRLVQERHLMVYFKDQALQTFARDKNWSGELKHTSGDFVMVVDSNMGALKTDTVMDKHIDYTVHEGADGELYAKVDLYYKNNGIYSWLTTRYKDWVRVYVPKGSVLLHADGAMVKELSPEIGTVEVGNELDKTYFGAYIVVEPRSTKHFSVEYRLPHSVVDQMKSGRYSLLVQKQAGVDTQQFKGNLIFNRPIKEYGPVGFFNTKTDTQSVQFQSDLRVDRVFSVTF